MHIPINFIDHLKEFVNIEQDTQNLEQEGIYRKPIEARVADALAINDLTVERFEINRAVLSFPVNRSKFREGDALRLHREDPTRNFIKCELVEETENNQLVLKPGFQQNFVRLEPSTGWVLDMDLTDIREIQLSALEEINQNEDLNAYYHRLFNGRVHQEFRKSLSEQDSIVPQALRGNSRQVEAFQNAYLASNFYLIQGPPGTGKTRVLAYLAEYFASQNMNVLITAFTHRAINNALKSIAKYTNPSILMKIGQSINANDLDWEGRKVTNYERFSDSGKNPKQKGMIIGGTCFALRSRRLQDLAFDVVIFDEAGQMPLPLALIGMGRAPKTIFIGDHKQMPPVITGEHAERWVQKSIFEVLFEHYPGTMLDVTYRMNDRIADFPSRQFYGGNLHSDKNNADKRIRLSPVIGTWNQVLSPEHPDVFVQIDHQFRTIDSIEEAEIAAELAVEAINAGLMPHELAIVAPYRAQGRLIKSELRKRIKPINLARQIVVDTVERIQGQEREMIIISLTTSDSSHAAKNAEFYFQPNRLNVAITRPKSKRIIIGSKYLFAAEPKSVEHCEWVRLFRELYEQCEIIQVKNKN